MKDSTKQLIIKLIIAVLSAVAGVLGTITVTSCTTSFSLKDLDFNTKPNNSVISEF